MKKILLALVLVSPLLGGCVVAAGPGSGYVSPVYYYNRPVYSQPYGYYHRGGRYYAPRGYRRY